MPIIIYWHICHSSGFHHICNIKCRLDCRYSPQNIFNAKNFNPHKKPISLLNVPIGTHGMQRTWWAEASTIIVTGPYWLRSPHPWTVQQSNGLPWRPVLMGHWALEPVLKMNANLQAICIQICQIILTTSCPEYPSKSTTQPSNKRWLCWIIYDVKSIFAV